MDSKENATSSGSAASGSSKLDESSVTMLDVLNEQNELEAESDAVLGGSDEKNCTYAQVRRNRFRCGKVWINFGFSGFRVTLVGRRFTRV